MKDLKITVLADDYCFRNELLGEHGLSMLIETPKGKVLFDTGQGLVMEHNIKKLGVDLSDLDAIALSHGHMDHTGGLKSFLEYHNRGEMPIYAHPYVFLERQKDVDGDLVPTGMPFEKEEIENKGGKFVLNTSPVEIIPGVLLSGKIGRDIKETNSKSHFIKDNGELIRDPFDDDQAVLIETAEGPVLVFGCAHAGVINTINHFKKETGHKSFYAMFGGTHLLQADDSQLDFTLEEIEKMGTKFLGLSHCTGVNSCAYFSKNFSGQYRQGIPGFTFEI